MNMYDRMKNGTLYLCEDEKIKKIQKEHLRMQAEFNQIAPFDMKKGKEILKKMFAQFEEGCYIEPPLHCNFGGAFIHFEKNVYVNFNLTCVDDTDIYVGEGTLFGPNVIITTTGHPINPELRSKLYQFSKPVYIGKNCWIGAGVVILPGVHIGDNTIIGAGSIVTKDIPAGVIALGNPCKVKREISDHDSIYFYKDERIDYEQIEKDWK